MPARAGWLLGIAAVIAVTAFAAVSVRARLERRAASAAHGFEGGADPRRWPGDEAVIEPVRASFPQGARVIRLALDPGHGAPNNHGNTSSYCVAEQDAMLVLAEEVAARLEETGRVEVRVTRDTDLVGYSERLADAAAWGADAFVSLHSDVRGRIERWSPSPDRDCPIALDAPGFAVLYSDEGDAALAARRRTLGRAVARRMSEAGFLAYGGAEYVGIYAADEESRGLFVDRHAPDQRIFVLRRATMPSVLVETHNALDPREAARFGDPETIDVLASAISAALADALPLTPRPGGT